MGIERGRDFSLRVGQVWLTGPELRIAAFAHAEDDQGSFNDSELSLRHNPSLSL